MVEIGTQNSDESPNAYVAKPTDMTRSRRENGTEAVLAEQRR